MVCVNRSFLEQARGMHIQLFVYDNHRAIRDFTPIIAVSRLRRYMYGTKSVNCIRMAVFFTHFTAGQAFKIRQ